MDIEFIDHLYPANAAVAARQLQGAATAEVRRRLRQEKSVPFKPQFLDVLLIPVCCLIGLGQLNSWSRTRPAAGRRSGLNSQTWEHPDFQSNGDRNNSQQSHNLQN